MYHKQRYANKFDHLREVNLLITKINTKFKKSEFKEIEFIKIFQKEKSGSLSIIQGKNSTDLTQTVSENRGGNC